MQRYFVKEPAVNNKFILDEEDRHHAIKVMRMNSGDQFVCVDPTGKCAVCEITEITDEQVTATVVQWKDEDTELPLSVTIASGLPKGDKLEWIIQKGTEMGAHEFVPFAAARSVVKWDEKKSAKKVERWQKIAKEAAEQSHRTIVPEVINPMNLKALIEKSKQYDYKIVAYEEESRRGELSNFASTLAKINKGQSLFLVFGPEGGLSDHEIALFKENDFLPCGLGPRILRTETAPLYALAAVSFHFELMR
ncbi:MAG: 16S rRNA (uracil(1498)-N(3))-methyltransferase [Bacillota bacterium]|nr:16S rRNA (uracil(1498)-N(3))-methyltransferase [Bacillota bacterium]